MTEEQNNAAGTEGRGRPFSACGAAVLIVLFLALLVFPGFVAAGFSKTALNLSKQGYVWCCHDHTPAAVFRAEGAVLALPLWLMNHAEPIRRFYLWQYQRAGGVGGIVE